MDIQQKDEARKQNERNNRKKAEKCLCDILFIKAKKEVPNIILIRKNPICTQFHSKQTWRPTDEIFRRKVVQMMFFLIKMRPKIIIINNSQPFIRFPHSQFCSVLMPLSLELLQNLPNRK